MITVLSWGVGGLVLGYLLGYQRGRVVTLAAWARALEADRQARVTVDWLKAQKARLEAKRRDAE